MKNYTFFKLFFFLMFYLKATGSLAVDWYVVFLPIIIIPIFIIIGMIGAKILTSRQEAEIDKLTDDFTELLKKNGAPSSWTDRLKEKETLRKNNELWEQWRKELISGRTNLMFYQYKQKCEADEAKKQ